MYKIDDYNDLVGKYINKIELDEKYFEIAKERIEKVEKGGD